MKEKEKMLQMMQAQLMQRASLLILMGVDARVKTDIYIFMDGSVSFRFWFGDIDLCFDKDTPFDQDIVDEAIVRLDGMIEEEYRKAEKTIEIVKAWRG